MALAAFPAGVKPGFRRLADLAAAVTAKVLQPAKPVLANLAKIPFTVAGWACIDAGVFTANLIAGLIVTGVTLMVLEHQIADEV